MAQGGKEGPAGERRPGEKTKWRKAEKQIWRIRRTVSVCMCAASACVTCITAAPLNSFLPRVISLSLHLLGYICISWEESLFKNLPHGPLWHFIFCYTYFSKNITRSLGWPRMASIENHRRKTLLACRFQHVCLAEKAKSRGETVVTNYLRDSRTE